LEQIVKIISYFTTENDSNFYEKSNTKKRHY